MTRSVAQWAVAMALAVAALVPAAANAGMALGARGGLSVAGISGDDTFADQTRLGFGGGLFLTVGVSDLFSIQPEVLWVSKGASWGESEATDENGNPIGTFETLTAVDYIEIPFLLRVTPPIGAGIRPVFVLGPTLGLELSEQLRTVGAVDAKTDTDVFKNTDWGGALGFGFEMLGGGGIWSIEGRYTTSLASIEESGSVWTDAKNWNFLVTLGFARAIQ